MKRIYIAVLMILLLAVGAVGLTACGGNRSEADEVTSDDGGKSADGDEAKGDAAGDDEEKEDAAVPVEVVALDRGAIESVLRFATNLEAEEEVGVYAQSSRQVRSLYVEEGDRVKKGQVLLRLDDDEQKTRLAKVNAELARARREFQRQESLYEDDLISEQAFNDSKYELDRLQLDQQDAERELSYTEVKAPISGTITQRLISVGDHVTINQHLFDMVDFDSIVARVYAPEKELSRLAEGKPARVTAPALGTDRLYRGSIERLSPVVDPKSGTVKVTVDIPRQEGLRPGMYVDVQLITDVHDDALLVPKRALIYDDDQVFVYRKKSDGTVERVYLEPVLEDEQFVEPAGGLSVGDEVVVAGQAALKDGAKVRLAGEKPAEERATADGAATDAEVAE